MNRKNKEYLIETIRFHGLGGDENLFKCLDEFMEKKEPEFQIETVAFFNHKQVRAVLSFRKSRRHDFFFFNKYTVFLMSGDEEISQTFFIDKGNGITLKEGFNLLEGRAVYKTLPRNGGVFKAWIQLDLSVSKRENGNYPYEYFMETQDFDLKRIVGKYPFTALAEAATAGTLFRSLQKGNLQFVEYEYNGQRLKGYARVDPSRRDLAFEGELAKFVAEQSAG